MPNLTRPPRWILRRADQAAVAALVSVAMLAVAGWWAVHGGWRGKLLEIDQAEPLTARFEVDLNKADWPELMQLPGVGETLAHRIVDSRQVSGPFRDPEDLRRVRGIGPKKLEAIRPYLRPMPGSDVAATGGNARAGMGKP
ncbi:MAG: helix-hairpin-helix domain-containing protein [Thermoguttaceae bacterium]